MAAAGRSFKDLYGWQRAMELVLAVYVATKTWPKDESFGIISQARQAAVSVPANIAEGQGRSGPREFLHHLSIAPGSLAELETHLLLAHQLTYMPLDTLASLTVQLDEVRRLIRGLIRSLRASA